jgi:hypothetical protein
MLSVPTPDKFMNSIHQTWFGVVTAANTRVVGITLRPELWQLNQVHLDVR